MKTITIRGIDPDLDQRLKQAASLKNKSINQLVLEFLRKDLGVEKEKQYTRIYHDLDDLFGRWSEAEYRDIQDKIDQEREIDPELWR
ncbi:MAG: antitoxin [Thermodesulfobacteriota bacterium]|nr:antitoxin [Thermodesulfobacteriota bacterium]